MEEQISELENTATGASQTDPQKKDPQKKKSISVSQGEKTKVPCVIGFLGEVREKRAEKI